MTTKYVVLIADGLGDEPIPDLRGKTPLEAAKTPNLDKLASKSEVGLVYTIPDGMKAGSDVGTLSLLGYNPRESYTGRAPLEAAAMGVILKKKEIAYRCNLVTVRGGILEDYSAGHIGTPDAKKLMKYLHQKLGNKRIRFYPGVSYRHVVVIEDGPSHVICVPPHDLQGRSIVDMLPTGEGSEVLLALMKQSVILLRDHPVNIKRIYRDQDPANMIWLWGHGTAPNLSPFSKQFKMRGGVISAVDLIKGMTKLIGFELIKVPGITGYFDTNYVGKAEYAIKALKKLDFVVVHVEAVDEAGHEGDLGAKIRAIEDFDKLVVGNVLKGLKGFPDHRIMVVADHPTPVMKMTHTSDPVPYIMYSSQKKRKGPAAFSEKMGGSTGKVIRDGYRLMPQFIALD